MAERSKECAGAVLGWGGRGAVAEPHRELRCDRRLEYGLTSGTLPIEAPLTLLLPDVD